MDSITLTVTLNVFTSAGVTPFVGMPVSGVYILTTINRIYKYVGTVTGISGSTIQVTATNGQSFMTRKYQHNVRFAITGVGGSTSAPRCMLHTSIITNSSTAISTFSEFYDALNTAGASGGPFAQNSLPATGFYNAGSNNRGIIYCIQCRFKYNGLLL